MSISPTPRSPQVRWQLLGGDRFYIAARWAVFILLMVIGSLLAEQPIWPLVPSMAPVLLLASAYGLFNLLATVALFVPSLTWLLNVELSLFSI